MMMDDELDRQFRRRLSKLRGQWLWLLYPIPLLWCLQSALTLHTMGEAQAWMPFVAVALAAAAGIATVVRRPAPPPA